MLCKGEDPLRPGWSRGQSVTSNEFSQACQQYEMGDFPFVNNVELNIAIRCGVECGKKPLASLPVKKGATWSYDAMCLTSPNDDKKYYLLWKDAKTDKIVKRKVSFVLIPGSITRSGGVVFLCDINHSVPNRISDEAYLKYRLDNDFSEIMKESDKFQFLFKIGNPGMGEDEARKFDELIRSEALEELITKILTRVRVEDIYERYLIYYLISIVRGTVWDKKRKRYVFGDESLDMAKKFSMRFKDYDGNWFEEEMEKIGNGETVYELFLKENTCMCYHRLFEVVIQWAEVDNRPQTFNWKRKYLNWYNAQINVNSKFSYHNFIMLFQGLRISQEREQEYAERLGEVLAYVSNSAAPYYVVKDRDGIIQQSSTETEKALTRIKYGLVVKRVKKAKKGGNKSKKEDEEKDEEKDEEEEEEKLVEVQKDLGMLVTQHLSEIMFAYSEFVPFAPNSKSTLRPDIFNEFTGLKAKPVEVMNLDVIEPFLSHLKDVWCDGDINAYNYVHNFFAYMFQHPENKLPEHLVVCGAQGSGKNTLSNFLRDFMFGSKLAFQTNKADDVSGNWNTAVVNKLLIICDEMKSLDDSSSKAKPIDWDTFKALCNNLMNVYKKFKDVQTGVKNYGVMIFFSNHLNPIRIEEGDRHYIILRTSSKYIGNEKYFDEINRKLNQECADHLLTYFLGVDLTGWKHTVIPLTEIRKEMLDKSRPGVYQWLDSHETFRDRDAVTLLAEFSKSPYCPKDCNYKPITLSKMLIKYPGLEHKKIGNKEHFTLKREDVEPSKEGRRCRVLNNGGFYEAVVVSHFPGDTVCKVVYKDTLFLEDDVLIHNRIQWFEKDTKSESAKTDSETRPEK
jgi:hypothetical protein